MLQVSLKNEITKISFGHKNIEKSLGPVEKVNEAIRIIDRAPSASLKRNW